MAPGTQDDSLFLLEVLIDKVVFLKSPCFSDRDFRTCVNIQCPAVDPLEICDDDPGSCVAKSGGPFVKTFNSGKSCLFSLKESDINNAMSRFPVTVTVYKSLPCGCLPTKIVMGEAIIDMTKEFVQSRKKYLEDPTTVSYEALKDTFRIVGPDKTETGGSGPPNLGTAGGATSFVDRSCVPRKEFQTSQDPCVCGAAQGAAGASASAPCDAPCRPGTQLSNYGVCPPAPDPYDSMPCENIEDPCYCSGGKPQKPQKMECRNTHQYCLHVPKDCCPPGNKVIFQMPSDTCGMNHKQRAHFNYNSDGVGDVSRDDPLQLPSPAAEDYAGVVYDFPEDVIKLRIGKTIEMLGRKTKLEYQFITPAIKHDKVVPVKDNRTAQCKPCSCQACCNVVPPKGALPSMPYNQDLKEDQIMNSASTNKEPVHAQETMLNLFKAGSSRPCSEIMSTFDEYLLASYPNSSNLSNESFQQKVNLLASSLSSFRSKSRSVTFSDNVKKSWDVYSDGLQLDVNGNFIFGKEEIVCTLLNQFNRHRNSGTQATASLNKCLQVTINSLPVLFNDLSTRSASYGSRCTPTIQDNYIKYSLPEQFRYSDVFYFGNKSPPISEVHLVGMGKSKKKVKRSDTEVQVKHTGTSNSTQTKAQKKTSSHGISIQEEKYASPPDLIATVSHIRIGPKEPCPIQGTLPCIGPKCIAAKSDSDSQAVKVTSVTNPRRGVFEIVIRKMGSTPLPRNELMLEWTPPPSAPGGPCGSCPLPRPSQCRLPCRSPCRPPKCRRKPCIKPCRRPLPCKRPSRPPCRRPCGVPCKKPCGPPCRRPCGLPCKKPCSSPCRRPCRVSCRRPCGIPCRKPCGAPCKKGPCRKPCGRPCLLPCNKPSYVLPCQSPCGSPCGLPCGSPCGLPCGPPAYLPCGSPCGPPCRLPCGSRPCRLGCGLFPCKRVKPCKGSPCPSPRCPPIGCLPVTCPPPKCRASCNSPCPPKPCQTPSPGSCRSSPCMRLCPVAYKKPRKSRSQPKIKPRRKRISPCYNRSRKCSTVRCRSGPCSSCAGIPCAPVLSCTSGKCYGPFPFKARCCQSSCTTNC